MQGPLCPSRPGCWCQVRAWLWDEMATSLQPAPLPSLALAQGEQPYPGLPRKADSGSLRGESEGGLRSLYLGFPSLPAAQPTGAAPPSRRRTWRHSWSWPASACHPWQVPAPSRPTRLWDLTAECGKVSATAGMWVLSRVRTSNSRTDPKSFLIQSYT